MKERSDSGDRSNVGELLALLRPYSGLAIAFLMLSVLGALAESIGIALFVPLANTLADDPTVDQSGLVPNAIAWTEDLLGGGLLTILIVIGIVFLIKSVIAIARDQSGNMIFSRIVRDLQQDFVAQMLDVEYRYVAQLSVGTLSETVLRRVFQTGSVVRAFLNMVSIGVLILALSLLMVAISWKLTLIALIIGAGVGLVNGWLTRRSRELGQQNYEGENRVAGIIHEVLAGNRMIRVYGQAHYEKHRMESAEKSLYRRRIRKLGLLSIPRPFTELVAVIGLSIMLVVGRSMFGGAEIALLGTFALVVIRLTPKLSEFNSRRVFVSAEFYNVESVTEFLGKLDKPYLENGWRVFTRLSLGIELRNVSFQYPGREDMAVSDLSFAIPIGSTTAIVGESGAGKSTLVDLVLRLYDPHQGTITLDDVDLREFDYQSWRRKVGVVPQDGFLFNASVSENIAFGNLDATERQIEEASRRASAYDFITALPDGFDTSIGESGELLSGGERQRIAIARAIVRDPEILVFDEATSHLDVVSERLIQQAIADLSHDRTVIIVAHRLSTIRHADNIVVLDGGRLVEQGSHQELMDRLGKYWEFHNDQYDGRSRTFSGLP